VLHLIEAAMTQVIGLQIQGLIPRIQVAVDNKTVFGIDLSIESLRSQEYSYFIFGFLVVSVIIFCVIIFMYLPKKGGSLKTGEKIMFGAIIFGVIVALFFGYLQLIDGFLV